MRVLYVFANMYVFVFHRYDNPTSLYYYHLHLVMHVYYKH